METRTQSPGRRQLIVFGRYPVPGITKTRLMPALGPAGAALLQRRLTERTLDRARRAARRTGARLVFCHAGGDATRLRRWLGGRVDEFRPQADGDLGQRMHATIRQAFAMGARQVVLVGTDVPGLTGTILARAFDALAARDIVLGPSTDGGYWLVGMKRPTDLFDGIAWSRDDVLDKTLARLEKQGLTHRLLDRLDDLDTPDDLDRHVGWVNPQRPYLSVVIPTLDEARHIGGTLSAAADADAELIVADGGSRDHTVDLARTYGARIVPGPKGRAGQQNRGASAARGEVLLFLHADTRLPAGYVQHLFDTLMDRRTVMGAFRFATALGTPAMRWVTFWTNQRAGTLGLPYGDQGLFLRKADFFRAGGFPEVPIAEDLYLVRRMARRGRIALAPAAVVTSARRWQRLGVVRTTLINTLIATGCLAGVAPHRLAPLYRVPGKAFHK